MVTLNLSLIKLLKIAVLKDKLKQCQPLSLIIPNTPSNTPDTMPAIPKIVSEYDQENHNHKLHIAITDSHSLINSAKGLIIHVEDIRQD